MQPSDPSFRGSTMPAPRFCPHERPRRNSYTWVTVSGYTRPLRRIQGEFHKMLGWQGKSGQSGAPACSSSRGEGAGVNLNVSFYHPEFARSPATTRRSARRRGVVSPRWVTTQRGLRPGVGGRANACSVVTRWAGNKQNDAR